uniref:major facilitator superfamily domain-containing protein 6 n=1 Tax=Ciona intestinalis TaxID=7719 RepID=UPI00006A62B8|nr:major facilitator superfamily domain-containing protein 6 [Ciona intestinalis]|eukprot:XP_004227026.1 major facilitator superfamily domain-containing protein 6 [Ciona intestinalis]
MKVEYDLLVVKLVNFLFYAGMACFMPYKAIYQKSIGLTPSQNGLIQALEKLITLFSPPIVGAISDKFSFHKSSMIICILLSVGFTFPMYFVPKVNNGLNHNVDCYVTNTTIVCSNSLNFTEGCNIIENVDAAYLLKCWDDYNNSATVTCEEPTVVNNQTEDAIQLKCKDETTEQDTYGLTFMWVVVLTVFYAFFTNPVQPLIDASTMNMLGENRMQDYGKQRLWGSVGFGSVALLVGFVTDVFTKSKSTEEKDYLFSFIGALVFGVLTSIVCYKLKVPKHNPPSILSGLTTLVKDPRIIAFLCIVMVGGYNLGVKYAFVFWYAESLPGCNQTIIGLAILTGCLTEVPMFFVSGWIAGKIGYNAILVFGLIFASLRCFLYTILTSAWQLLLVEALHGLSFALPMAAMCSYAATLAPEGMTATLIGLTQGVYWGLGNMLGALLGGVLYRLYSPIVMFRITALIGVVAAMFYSISMVCLINYNSGLKVEEGSEGEREACNIKTDEA